MKNESCKPLSEAENLQMGLSDDDMLNFLPCFDALGITTVCSARCKGRGEVLLFKLPNFNRTPFAQSGSIRGEWHFGELLWDDVGGDFCLGSTICLFDFNFDVNEISNCLERLTEEFILDQFHLEKLRCRLGDKGLGRYIKMDYGSLEFTVDNIYRFAIDLGCTLEILRDGERIFRWWVDENPMQMRFEDMED